MNSEVLKLVVSSLVKCARRFNASEPRVYISTKDDCVSFYYSEKALSVERMAPADISAQLNAVTDLFNLEKKVQALPKEDIRAEIVDNSLLLRWGGRNSKIKVDLFPETMVMLEPPTPDEIIEWRPGTLHGFTKMLTPYCSTDSNYASSKPALFGVELSKTDNEVYLRVMDGHRYIRRRANMEWFDHTTVVSSTCLHSISDVLPNDVNVRVGISKSGLISFQSGNVTCVTTPLDGVLPAKMIDNLDIAIRTKQSMTLSLDRMEVIEISKRVQKVAGSKGYIIFEFKEDKIFIHSNDKSLVQDIGGTYEGEVTAIAINAAYLETIATTFIQNKGTGELSLRFNDYKSPIFVNYDGEDRTDIMLLPIVVSEVLEIVSKTAEPVTN